MVQGSSGQVLESTDGHSRKEAQCGMGMKDPQESGDSHSYLRITRPPRNLQETILAAVTQSLLTETSVLG